jgi:hypothetical protein
MARYHNMSTREIFQDLDRYRDFCRNYGYRFNEADLYNNKKYPYQQFRKFEAGKNAKDMWIIDAGRPPRRH